MHRQMQRQSTEVLFGEQSGQRDEVPLVLFVCVHNAGRSRMAEALFEHLAQGRYRAESAGTDPAPAPHAEVVSAMRDIGLEIADAPGRLLTPELADEAHLVVGMGCNVEEACPALTVPLEDWGLDDPKGKSADEVADIRDQIELRVRNLIGRLDRDSS
ncbi:MAG TPA: hypothetical protein VFK89_04640 [Actinomycetota bacterium]|nr:hypothetical protein [Actinomycetota bacterium]